MSVIERKVQTNEHGYQEVVLDYRVARATMLDARKVGARTGRITCPMLDASRTDSAYGQMALPGTRGKDLKAWADALGTSAMGIKIVAYLSEPFWRTPLAFILGRFDDRRVNTGFIHSFKGGANTGVLARETFDQDALNAFVWAVRPELAGTLMTSEWLYSENSAGQYLDSTMLPAIRAHNKSNAKSWLGRRMGLFMSMFEMKFLLLGVLAQPVPAGPQNPSEKVNAILLRDVHDIFKYGWIPAAAEQRLNAAGLLDFPPVHVGDTP